MYRLCSRFVAVLLVVGTGLITAPAHAQQTRTLTIHNGQVIIDGRTIPADALPDGLRVEGLEAQYRFVGIAHPVVELNGSLYAVNDGLEPVSKPEARGQSVIVQGTPQQAARPAEASPSPPQSAQQAYLQEMERRSRDLYRRLKREQAMEGDAQERARLIRVLPDGPERDVQIDSLRAALQRIFELKQDNRRREIEYLQQQIQEIQRRIQKRERMREAMIQHRMQHLVPSLAPGGSR